MKSRITIEVDFENQGNPYILIKKQKSDDVRDKLISYFGEKQQGSAWCKFRWGSYDLENGVASIIIEPLTEEDLKEQAEIMLEQDRLYKKNRENFEKYAQASLTEHNVIVEKE